MRIKTAILAALATVTLVAAGAALADTAKVMAENLARFEKFAGKPQDSVTVFQLQGWQPLGADHIAIWTGVNDVYLIKVAKPCINLSWTNSVGINPHMNQLQARFDSIHVRGMPCQIETIQKVDYRALRKSESTQGKVLDPKPMTTAATGAQPVPASSGG
ncbi:DUF6491 family protein [Metallibacterium sp.]|uniref:DUF6491 family protein n=1 Tax=Metallibacterium sp. TaxID=2940281 RepID=UPI00260E2AEE|nr:DUF6491 family protein [Metallibacterium sp.]